MSDTLLQIIDNITNDQTVKSIINSENSRQHACKDWLIDQTENYIGIKENFSICIAGGWYGLMAHKFRKKYGTRITKLSSFDRDKQCIMIGEQMYPESDINFEWQSIQNYNPINYDVIVSTSCEHFSDTDLNNFLSKKKLNAVVILQSNNYNSISDHVNCKKSLQEFADAVNLTILDQQQLDTEAYTRYMIVAR